MLLPNTKHGKQKSCKHFHSFSFSNLFKPKTIKLTVPPSVLLYGGWRICACFSPKGQSVISVIFYSALYIAGCKEAGACPS